MTIFQKTIQSQISCEGIGLHTGCKSAITFKPTNENAGIQFVRKDIDDKTAIPALVQFVVNTNRGTTLQKGGVAVYTVEHVLSAVNGIGIDNIIIELNGPEPPIMDGSAKAFVDLLSNAGIREQSAEQNKQIIETPIHFSLLGRDSRIEVIPSSETCFTYKIDNKEIFGFQEMTLFTMEDYTTQIAEARTYCFLSEVEEIYNHGLAKGGSLENTIVFSDCNFKDVDVNILKKEFGLTDSQMCNSNGVVGDVSLRFENEPVRHKLLDLIGDFTLLGRPIQGHITAINAGHETHVEFIKKLKEDYSL